jgi:hypothetical protein
MKDYLMIDIACRINALAESDGVKALANMSPTIVRNQPYAMKCWDIELTYNNYHYVERFNNSMPIDDFEIDRVAVSLLKTLFADYYEAKCLASPSK